MTPRKYAMLEVIITISFMLRHDLRRPYRNALLIATHIPTCLKILHCILQKYRKRYLISAVPQSSVLRIKAKWEQQPCKTTVSQTRLLTHWHTQTSLRRPVSLGPLTLRLLMSHIYIYIYIWSAYS